MTIDESIAYVRETVKYYKSKYDKCPTRMKYDCKMCFHKPKCNEIAEEHEQLAELLEELKNNRIALEKANGYLEANYKLGYNKAIDDFADKLKVRSIKVSTVKEHAYFKAVGTNEVDKIAEQLKAGGENEG